MNALGRPALVFDLDGTLWDASRAIAEGWNEAWAQFKSYPEFHNTDFHITEDQIRSVAGLPYRECVERVFESVFKTLDEANAKSYFQRLCDHLEKFEHQSVQRQGGHLYPFVVETIKTLAENYPLYLVSNCQTWYLEVFLEKSGMRSFFTDVMCVGQPGANKVENLKLLKEKYNLKKPVYIGDTHWDQKAAFYAGFRFLFVTYGFGEVNRLRTPMIHAMVELPNQIKKLLAPFSGISFRSFSNSELERAKTFYQSVGYTIEIDPEDQFFVAEYNQQIIAQVRVSREQGIAVLRGMQVRPDFQFQGIGTQLLKDLAMSLKSDCYCIPYKWLREFYSQIGFKEIESRGSVPEFLQERFLKYQSAGNEMSVMKRPHGAL